MHYWFLIFIFTVQPPPKPLEFEWEAHGRYRFADEATCQENKSSLQKFYHDQFAPRPTLFWGWCEESPLAQGEK